MRIPLQLRPTVWDLPSGASITFGVDWGKGEGMGLMDDVTEAHRKLIDPDSGDEVDLDEDDEDVDDEDENDDFDGDDDEDDDSDDDDEESDEEDEEE